MPLGLYKKTPIFQVCPTVTFQLNISHDIMEDSNIKPVFCPIYLQVKGIPIVIMFKSVAEMKALRWSGSRMFQ